MLSQHACKTIAAYPYFLLLTYFCKISFSWSLATCKLLINLGILYCMAARRMQFASGWWPTERNLHPAGGRLNEICTWLAADGMINTEQLAANKMQNLQKMCN
jgi:hypothetical protein